MSAVKCVRADFNGIDGMDMCRSSLAGAKINSLYSIHVTNQPHGNKVMFISDANRRLWSCLAAVAANCKHSERL